MKIRFILFIVPMVLLFGSVDALAQEKCSGPIKSWVRVEGGGLTNDYIVEFLIPTPKSWKLVARGNKENRVLQASSRMESSEQNGSRLRVVLTTGKSARVKNLLMSNIYEWANALSVCYVPRR